MTNGRGNWQGRSVLPGLYLRRQLADLAGVSYDTVVRWQREGALPPVDKAEGKRGPYYFNDLSLRLAIRLKELDRYNVTKRLDIINLEIARGDFDDE